MSEPKEFSSTAVYGPDEPFKVLSITMPQETLENMFAKNKNGLSQLFRQAQRFSNQPYAL